MIDIDNNDQDFDDGDIQFTSDKERELFTEARLGQEALDFLRTPLGKWLRGVAEQEKKAALEELLTVPFNNQERILQLQLKGGMAANLLTWIGEAIQNGRYAEEELENLNEE
ncbi:MAG: hypothetical protein LPD71_00100 [Shewanella sp.]|nr:hypothetical protein [Shewanella sp.]MCF1437203.1 hypothetical protein [Shewanella sp.]MCF1459483.1 hypothetical protein [Shewanella sp.]